MQMQAMAQVQAHHAMTSHMQQQAIPINSVGMQHMHMGHTQPGDVVLDCFSGAGSTIIACNNTGRSFKGCEFDEEYVTKSLERLEKLSK